MKNTERVFSAEEARALLPRLDAVLGSLMEKRRAHIRRHDELLMHELLCQAESRGGIAMQAGELDRATTAVDTAIEDMGEELSQLRELGATVRDLDDGHVHLPGRIGNEPVYFCWRYGDKDIRSYHRRDCCSGDQYEIA